MTLKVYQGAIRLRGDQVRACVAANSWAEAHRIVSAHLPNTSLGYMKNYWSITGNEKQIAAAMARPLTLLWASGMGFSHNYKPAQWMR